MAAPAVENGIVLLVYLNKMTERKIKAHQSSKDYCIQFLVLSYSLKLERNWPQLHKKAIKFESSRPKQEV